MSTWNGCYTSTAGTSTTYLDTVTTSIFSHLYTDKVYQNLNRKKPTAKSDLHFAFIAIGGILRGNLLPVLSSTLSQLGLEAVEDAPVANIALHSTIDRSPLYLKWCYSDLIDSDVESLCKKTARLGLSIAGLFDVYGKLYVAGAVPGRGYQIKREDEIFSTWISKLPNLELTDE